MERIGLETVGRALEGRYEGVSEWGITASPGPLRSTDIAWMYHVVLSHQPTPPRSVGFASRMDGAWGDMNAL